VAWTTTETLLVEGDMDVEATTVLKRRVAKPLQPSFALSFTITVGMCRPGTEREDAEYDRNIESV